MVILIRVAKVQTLLLIRGWSYIMAQQYVYMHHTMGKQKRKIHHGFASNWCAAD